MMGLELMFIVLGIASLGIISLFKYVKSLSLKHNKLDVNTDAFVSNVSSIFIKMYFAKPE